MTKLTDGRINKDKKGVIKKLIFDFVKRNDGDSNMVCRVRAVRFSRC